MGESFSFFTKLPQINKIIFYIGALGVMVGTLGTRLAPDAGLITFFENMHWTFSIFAAALLSALGYRRNRSTSSSKTALWFLIGFASYAVGQLIWDIQALFSYSGFPAPSDFFFLLIGPSLSIALFYTLHLHAETLSKPAFLLDLAGLSIAALTLILVSYLPRGEGIDTLSMSVLVGYPITLIIPVIMLVLMIPSMRIQINAGLSLFLISIAITAADWMYWNSMALDGVSLSGSWSNVLFSVVILIAGLVVSDWHLTFSEHKQYERFCEAGLRILPIITVILSSLAVIAVGSDSQVTYFTKQLVYFGAAIVIVIAIIRQSHLLHDKESMQKETLERLTLATTHNGIGIWDWNLQSMELVWDDSMFELYHIRREEFSGAVDAWEKSLHPEDKDKAEEEMRLALSGEKPFDTEFRVVWPNGEIHYIKAAAKTFFDDNGKAVRMLGTSIDISEKREAFEKIEELAFYDPLTALPNRRLLLDRLRHALAYSERNKKMGALLFLDIDHFKTINDTLGHDMGDLLLKQVARRLNSCIRKSDSVARFGGDEFVILLESISQDIDDTASQTLLIAEKILSTIKEPYRLKAHEYKSTVSIGITLYDGYDTSIDELLKQADIAMYHSKEQGRNKICFFDIDMQHTITARVKREFELRKALENREFQLYYQVQVDREGKQFGAEALIRWLHPEHGMVPPLDFIPLAEETGLILPIGAWVIDHACAQLKRWEQHEDMSHLTLSVNVSVKQFRQKDFVDQVKAAIDRHTINPARLKLELVESLLLDDIDEVIASMHALRDIGIMFELDDFGTGYSSLQYLKTLPLHQLKIDRSFVRDIATDINDRAIILTIITMAKSMGIEVIAEGVETPEQQQFLIDNGCTKFQGYLFSKPLSCEDFEALVRPKSVTTDALK